MKMFLTRMGNGSKIIVTGDMTRSTCRASMRSGLVDAVHRLKNIERIGIVYLDENDIVRHPLVQRIVRGLRGRQAAQDERVTASRPAPRRRHAAWAERASDVPEPCSRPLGTRSGPVERPHGTRGATSRWLPRLSPRRRSSRARRRLADDHRCSSPCWPIALGPAAAAIAPGEIHAARPARSASTFEVVDVEPQTGMGASEDCDRPTPPVVEKYPPASADRQARPADHTSGSSTLLHEEHRAYLRSLPPRDQLAARLSPCS